MSKKPEGKLKVHLLVEHRQAEGSEYTESTVLEIHANYSRATQRKAEMEDELMAMDFSEEAFEPDWVAYEVDSRAVEGICK